MWYAFEGKEITKCGQCPISRHTVSRGVLVKHGHCELLMKDVSLESIPDDCPLVPIREV